MLIQRVVVTGSRFRKYEDRALITETLDKLHKEHRFELLIQGGAEGVDTLARMWCFTNGIPCATVDAQWVRYGNNAGPIRNSWMAELFNIDAVIAFPGGNGTADMIGKAISAGIDVIKIDETP